MNPKIMGIYQDAHIKRLEEQMDIINYTAWLQGQYNLSAIGANLGKKIRYPKKPHELREKEQTLSETEKFKLWVEEWNKRFD